jgi:hypothetical protein
MSGELTADSVTAVFVQLSELNVPDVRMTIGAGVLRCGECGELLRGGHGGSSNWAAGSRPRYDCPGCGEVSITVSRVDGRLQDFTMAELSRAAVVSRIRMERARELDTKISDGLRIRAWCMDPVHQKELKRSLRRRGTALPNAKVGWYLLTLARQISPAVLERARLSGPDPSATSLLSDLESSLAGYAAMYVSTQLYARDRRAAIKQAGGRRKVGEDLRLLDDHIWTLLAETAWRDSRPAEPPTSDKAFQQDWDKSSSTLLTRRNELLRLAVADGQLTVSADGDVRYEPA